MATSQVFNNLTGGTNRGKFPAVQGSELSVNMYRGMNGKVSFQESMPGLKRLYNISGNCRGCYVSTRGLRADSSPEDMFAVFGNMLYRLTNTGYTALFPVAASQRRVCFAETGGPRAMMLVADGASLHWYDLQEGTFGQVQLPAAVEGDGHTVRPTFVQVVSGCIVINDIDSGYCYYSKSYPLADDTRQVFDLDNGQVQYESDGITVKMKTVSSFDWCFYDDYHVQMFFSGESSSDCVNGLIAVGAQLYVFGPKSVEIMSYLGQENNNWSRLYFSAQDSFGLEAPSTLCSVDNAVYFISSGKARGKCCMKAVGTNFEVISDNWLDEKLESEPTDTAFAFPYATGEHSFVVFQLPTLGECWCHDLTTGDWHQRTSRDRKSGLECRWRASGVAYWRQKLYAFTSDGCVCEFSGWVEEFPDGYSLPVIRHRQTEVLVSDNRPFILEEIAIECNTGSHASYDREPEVLLEISKDGGNTYGNVRHANFGNVGEYSHRVRFHACGMVRLAVMRVTFSEPMDFVITSCDIRAAKTAAMI